MDREDILEDINEHYNKKTLTVIAAYLGLLEYERLNKIDLVESVVEGLYSRENFSRLYSKLSHEAKLVITHLTWDGISTISHMDSKYHIKLSLGDFYDNCSDPFIKHFKNYYSKEIQLSTGLRTLFKNQIPIEALSLVSNNFTEDNIIFADTIVVENLDSIFEFIQSNEIVTRELKKNLLIKPINKFGQIYNISDPLDNLRKVFMLRFLSYIQLKSESIESLSVLVKAYTSGRLIEDDNIDRYLFYPNIKGFNSNPTIDIFLKRARHSFFNQIRGLSGWVNIQSLVRQQSLGEDTQIFDTTFFGSILNVKLAEEFTRNFSPTINLLHKEDNEDLLLRPLCRGIIFFLYSIGAADIVIDKESKDYGFSPLESLTHFRITSLGKRLFGLKSSYKKPLQAESSCTFNDRKLIITILGEDSALHNFCKSIALQLSEGLYILTFETFFKECSSDKQIEYKLDKLTTLLGDNLSNIWKDFISEISDRIHPTYNEQELIVINFPKEDEAFISTIMDTSKIRSLFLMVEGFKGAFSSKNYKEFIKIMKEYGYII